MDDTLAQMPAKGDIMNQALWMGVLGLVLGFGGLAQASEDEIAAIEAQIHEIARVTTAAETADARTAVYMSYFAADPTLLPAGRPAIPGRAAVSAFYRQAFDGLEMVSLDYRDIEIRVVQGMAVRRYIGTAVFVLPGETEPTSSTNRYIDVLAREDGIWKMVWHAFVPVPAE